MSDQANETTQTETTPTNSGSNSGQVTFTPEQQEQVNRLIGEARKSGRQAGMGDLLKELEVDDPKVAKQMLTDAKNRAEAEKSETQKALDRADAEAKRAEKAELELKAEREQRVLDKRDSAIKAKAANAHDPDAILEWANRPANKALLEKAVNEDGSTNEAAVIKLVDACRTAAPHLFKTQPGSPSTKGGRVPDGTKPDAEKRAARTSQRIIRG